LFYVFYPAHLVVIYLISLLLNKWFTEMILWKD
jgi:hypothetical protein